MFSLHLLNFRLYGIGRKGSFQPSLIKNMVSEYVWCQAKAPTARLCQNRFYENIVSRYISVEILRSALVKVTISRLFICNNGNKALFSKEFALYKSV